MIDVHTAILDFLLRDAALRDLVGERMYAGRNVPPVGYLPEQGPCVVFKTRGGRPDYEDALLMPSVQFKCYGADEVTAGVVYRMLFDALQSRAGGGILHAESETLGEPLEEPETEWRFVLSFWRVMIRA